MPKTPPDGMQRIVPMLVYKDAPAAIDFLTAAFGFSEVMRLAMPDGRIGHANLSYGGNGVFISSEYPEIGLKEPRAFEGAHARIQCYVDDVDAHFARAKAAGAEIVQEPEDQFHGSRTYRAVDSGGHHWMFSTVIRDATEEDLQGFLKTQE